MIQTNKKNIFCASPAPLLWKGLFFFIPALTVVLIVLVSQTLIRMYVNKKRRRKVIDKPIIILTLWSIVVFLSLISYGIIGLDFKYYLLEFFLLTVFVLLAFFIGEHFKLFVVHRSRWIFVAALSLIFAGFFTVCFVNAIREDAAFAKGMETRCFNRLLF